MLFDGKQLESLTEADLTALVADQVREMRVLDYKLTLPGGTDAEKREFLADVSSFSNTMGGHVIYGMSEANGLPTAVLGFDTSNLDGEILRLENLLRTGVAPRLPGVKLAPVSLASGKDALVIQVPRSWQLPHVVTLIGSFRFFARNSAGKYQLDVTELRSLFDLTGRAIDKVRQFRLARISEILHSAGAVTLPEGAKLILHVVPLSDLEQARIPISSTDVGRGLLPIYGGASDYRINFDGVLANAHTDESGITHAYAQLFRSGAIEAVDTFLLSRDLDGKWMIPSLTSEKELIEALGQYLKLIADHDIQPPVAIMLTLTGVKGISMGVTATGFPSRFPRQIDRDELIIPEVLAENLETPADQLLRPVLETVWNAAGWVGSPYYGDDDRWQGEKK